MTWWMLGDVDEFSFLGLKWQSKKGGASLSGLLWLVSSYCSHVNQIVSICEREYMNRIKTKNKITSTPGMMYFLTWWMNCEPGSLSVVSNCITRSNERYPLFLKNAIAFVYFGVGRTYRLRIAMLCKGSIAFISYLMALQISIYNCNLGNTQSSSQGSFWLQSLQWS